MGDILEQNGNVRDNAKIVKAINQDEAVIKVSKMIDGDITKFKFAVQKYKK